VLKERSGNSNNDEDVINMFVSDCNNEYAYINVWDVGGNNYVAF
jgi:hypothetical protein